VGIKMCSHFFVHAWEKSQTVKTSPLKQWLPRLVAAYRFDEGKLV